MKGEGEKGLNHIIFSRTALIMVLLLAQALLLVGTFRFLGQYVMYAFGRSLLLLLGMTLYRKFPCDSWDMC